MSIKELATAMAKAQAEIKAALKDSKNPHFKSSYADLTSVWDACRTALTKNGLSVVQIPGFDANDVWLETMILHSSGESLSGRYPLRPSQQTPQGYGSALTYARRYSLAAMVGVVADEDDDGNAASQRGNYEPPARQAPPPKPDPVPAAKSYVDEAIRAIGTLTDATGLNAWVEANKSKLERLRDVYDEGSRQVSGAILEQRKSLMRGAAE
jgi:hypothetical protein